MLISPPTDDCKDYAITRRHKLLAHGWPSRALLLSEVVVPSGEHHLILVARTKDTDWVLDNLNANISSVAAMYRQYEWVRIETPQPRCCGREYGRRTLCASDAFQLTMSVISTLEFQTADTLQYQRRRRSQLHAAAKLLGTPNR